MELMTCTHKSLPDDMRVEAAATAIRINPTNRPRVGRIIRVIEAHAGVRPSNFVLPAGHLALLTQKYWGPRGTKLTVGFTESIQADLRDRLLSHMNAWSAYCNVSFVWTQTSPQVRISRGSGGYWSYIGTDILHIPQNQQTMNLEGFTMQSPESEFRRVVRHETGHTLGFPHEHMRKEIVQRIDPAKAVAYFGRTQGWSAAEVQQQVLTPLSEASIMGTEHADQTSIMCYQLPGSITTDGQPILGGTDIDAQDQAFSAKIYPLAVVPPPPPPPGAVTVNIPKAGTYTLTGPANGLTGATMPYTYVFSLDDVKNVLPGSTASYGLKWNSGAQLLGFVGQQILPAGAPFLTTDARGEQELTRIAACDDNRMARSLFTGIDWQSVALYLAKFLLQLASGA